jgi:hypothetical protein
MAAFDASKFKTNDWGVVGAGAVAIIGLFFHAYSVKSTVKGFGSYGGSLSGWHFKGLWFGVLFLAVAAAFVFIKVQGLMELPSLPIGPTLAVLTADALGTLFILIRVFTYPSVHATGVSAGASFGSYLILIAGIVATVFAALDFKSSGEDISDFKRITDSFGGSDDGNPPAV